MKKKLLTTTRITGLMYLGLAISGVLAFLFVRSNIYVDGDAVTTATNLVNNEDLARLGVAAEVALVGFQTLAAVWFYKLFRKVNSFAAGLIAVFGSFNAIAILISSAIWLSALDSALAANSAEVVYSLFNTHDNIWLVAHLFFGLWLLPMGYLAAKSKMPRPLAWFLIAGGIGYVLSTFVSILFPTQTTLAESLPLLASVGEFWMIGYLITKSKLNLEKA